MKTVWKYPIPLGDIIEIPMPRDARVLHVALQGREPTIWALVDDEHEPVMRRFRLAGTGQDLLAPLAVTEYLHHVGSFQIPNLIGEFEFVGHLFEVKQRVPPVHVFTGEGWVNVDGDVEELTP